MFDHSFYQYDPRNLHCEASLADGAYLYRVASRHHNKQHQILTGLGASRREGRYHSINEPTSYCANNVIVCIAERLFHMYSDLMKDIAAESSTYQIQSQVELFASLVVLRVHNIGELVKVDAESVRVAYAARMAGTVVTFPGSTYRPFRDFNREVRRHGKNGVLYPSARHSQDLCLALFLDHTSKIRPDDYHMIDLTLQLIPEDQPHGRPPTRTCDPFKTKIHPTMGHYRFDDPAQLRRIKGLSLLNPSDVQPSGLVDFVRRQYVSYPTDALR